MRNGVETADNTTGPISNPNFKPTKPPVTAPLADVLAQQQDYMTLRYRVALGMLAVAPALIALPPRKLDVFSFGLAGCWVYSLNEVVRQTRGQNLAYALGGERRVEAAKKSGAAAGLGGWRGDDVIRQHKEREEEGKGIGEMIGESVWDVWQQRDKRKLTPEEEEEEERPLRERLERYERLEKERREKVAEEVKEITKK
ncbi:hypothetical protein EDC01DRAFT_637659 [Geopyxis carbonaria]|nr:hypothetical protein EDC01DRAFT_637659 [Geopyxis carbonaria]